MQPSVRTSLTSFFRQDLLMRHYERRAARGRDLKRPSNKPLHSLSASHLPKDNSHDTSISGSNTPQISPKPWLPVKHSPVPGLQLDKLPQYQHSDKRGSHSAGRIDQQSVHAREAGHSPLQVPLMVPVSPLQAPALAQPGIPQAAIAHDLSFAGLPQPTLSPPTLPQTGVEPPPVVPQHAIPKQSVSPGLQPDGPLIPAGFSAHNALPTIPYHMYSNSPQGMPTMPCVGFGSEWPVVGTGIRQQNTDMFNLYSPSLSPQVPRHEHGPGVHSREPIYAAHGHYSPLAENRQRPPLSVPVSPLYVNNAVHDTMVVSTPFTMPSSSRTTHSPTHSLPTDPEQQ